MVKNARPENAGLENAGPGKEGPNREGGNYRTTVAHMIKPTLMYPTLKRYRSFNYCSSSVVFFVAGYEHKRILTNNQSCQRKSDAV